MGISGDSAFIICGLVSVAKCSVLFAAASVSLLESTSSLFKCHDIQWK